MTLVGCRGGDTPQPPEVRSIDSAGVELVLVPGRALDLLPARSLAPEPVLSIGGDQLSGFPLSWIAGGLILADDRIAIADRSLDEIAVVSPDGVVLHRFGRVGEGPGELGDVSGLRRRFPGELVVWDESRGRLMVYDTAGDLQETIQTPVFRTAQLGLDFPGFLGDGSPVFERRPGPLQIEFFEGLRRTEFTVDRYGPDGAFEGALASIPGKQMVGFAQGRSRAFLGVELTGAPHIAAGGGRAFVGHGERLEIQTWSAHGLDRITRIERPRKAASPAEREAIRDSVVARRARIPFGGGLVVRRSDIPVGDSFPAFEALRADADGGLWIEEGRDLHEGPASWIILGRGGEPLARIHVRRGFDILDIRGDLVLGTSRDELDVPEVSLYRIEGGG